MNHQPLTPTSLMTKARRASISAHALLELGDYDGAANRAYYAMFDAARAALLASRAPIESELSRTHSGLIGAFGLHLVKAGSVSKDMGKLLNRAHEIRQAADYSGDSVELIDVKMIVEQAKIFIDAMHVQFMQSSSHDGGSTTQ